MQITALAILDETLLLYVKILKTDYGDKVVLNIIIVAYSDLFHILLMCYICLTRSNITLAQYAMSLFNLFAFRGMMVTSGSVTLKKDGQNLVGISIGGGAPLCPCLYVVQVRACTIQYSVILFLFVRRSCLIT